MAITFKEYYTYSLRDVAKGKIKPEDLPKPHPFTFYGKPIPGTGCPLPGTDIIVPGTEIYQRRDGTKSYPDGFKILADGSYRIVVPQYSDDRCTPLKDDSEYTHEAYQKQLEDFNPKLAKKKKPKNHYDRMMARVKSHQLSKSQIRLVKQTVSDSSSATAFWDRKKRKKVSVKNFRMSANSIEKLLVGAKKIEKHKIDSEAGRIAKTEKVSKKDAKKKAADKFKSKNFEYNAADAVLAALAECYNVSPYSLAKIRTGIRRRKAMIQAGKIWERGRKKKLKPRRKFWERVYPELPVESEISIITSSRGPLEQYARLAQRQHTIDNLDLSFLDRPRTVQVFNYSGGYARAGDPKKMETTEALSDRIKAFKAKEKQQSFSIMLTDAQKKSWKLRKHQESQHTSRRKQVLLCPTVTTGTESLSASLSADSRSMA